MSISDVYLDGNEDMISALLVTFMAPNSKVDPGTSVGSWVALSFSACSSYCFLCVVK